MTLNFGNQLFPPRGERLANFDWVDISNGLGYEVYYGFLANSGETGTTNSTVTKSEVIKTYIELDGTPTKIIEKDFDITFNLPKLLKGKLITSIPIATWSNQPGMDVTMFTILKIYHYDGSTETLLGTDTSLSQVWTNVFQNGSSAGFSTTNINIARTHFKKGETLRITIEVWGSVGNAAGETYGGIAHDPASRNDLSEIGTPGFRMFYDSVTNTHSGTQLSFQVPFIITD